MVQSDMPPEIWDRILQAYVLDLEHNCSTAHCVEKVIEAMRVCKSWKVCFASQRTRIIV
jgi:hypothetical protein